MIVSSPVPTRRTPGNTPRPRRRGALSVALLLVVCVLHAPPAAAEGPPVRIDWGNVESFLSIPVEGATSVTLEHLRGVLVIEGPPATLERVRQSVTDRAHLRIERDESGRLDLRLSSLRMEVHRVRERGVDLVLLARPRAVPSVRWTALGPGCGDTVGDPEARAILCAPSHTRAGHEAERALDPRGLRHLAEDRRAGAMARFLAYALLDELDAALTVAQQVLGTEFAEAPERLDEYAALLLERAVALDLAVADPLRALQRVEDHDRIGWDHLRNHQVMALADGYLALGEPRRAARIYLVMMERGEDPERMLGMLVRSYRQARDVARAEATLDFLREQFGAAAARPFEEEAGWPPQGTSGCDPQATGTLARMRCILQMSDQEALMALEDLFASDEDVDGLFRLWREVLRRSTTRAARDGVR